MPFVPGFLRRLTRHEASEPTDNPRRPLVHLPCASGLPAVGLPEGETPKTAKNSVSSPSASPSSAYGLGGSPLADGANVGPLPVLLGRTRAGLGP
eukprot:CAMPEP_0179141608 /NCGR_PEP_ID=MMETSP0796-20121207/67938_1 /TAXON_ID=73915 /ORGANISM="Pyrodinium bahamense, Strain pbaha01" /LENGTH=94 /DNA_ID=CAMNT_0020841365 /DNA_START=61 /DNA_END=342 /DNA_ORIENTATION=+